MRVLLAACMGMVVATVSPVAHAYFLGPPFLTPARPTPNDIIVVNIATDGCDTLDYGIFPPTITRDGNAIRIVFTGDHQTDPLFCIYTPGIQTEQLDAFPIGHYTLDIEWRHGFIQDNLGTLPFTVSGPSQAIAAPTVDYFGMAVLGAMLVICGCRHMGRRRETAFSG